jgi:hypothetical protein
MTEHDELIRALLDERFRPVPPPWTARPDAGSPGPPPAEPTTPQRRKHTRQRVRG